MEERMRKTMADYESRGGIVKAIEEGTLQRDLARQSYELQEKISKGEKVLVGVNRFTSKEEEKPIEVYRANPKIRDAQTARLKEVKAKRDSKKVQEALTALRRAAEKGENIFPTLFPAVEARATVGEIISALKQVFGEYQEPRTI
jgi:methylmalonyl-CoA mutase N-terminal domain/subunit